METELTEYQLYNKLKEYSERYEISIQLWPEQNAIYICKDNVNLKSFGGHIEPKEMYQKAIDYLDKINGNEARNYK